MTSHGVWSLNGSWSLTSAMGISSFDGDVSKFRVREPIDDDRAVVDGGLLSDLPARHVHAAIGIEVVIDAVVQTERDLSPDTHRFHGRRQELVRHQRRVHESEWRRAHRE